MAEQTLTFLTCDVCGGKPAERFILGREQDGTAFGRRVDLCEEHAKPVEGAMAQAQAPEVGLTVKGVRNRQARRQRSGPETRIYSQEELDKMEEKHEQPE